MSARIRRGWTRKTDARAAAEALAEAVAQPDATTFLFASSHYDLEALGPALAERFEGPVVGCTTAGELTPEGYARGSISAFSIPTAVAQVHLWPIRDLAKHTSSDLTELGHRVGSFALELKERAPDHGQFGLLLVDGMCEREEEVVGHLGPALPGIPVVGGSAGDDEHHQQTHLLLDGRFETDAALLALVSTARPFAPIRSQNFEPTDAKLVITAADPADRRVLRIDGRPAAEAYAAVIGLPVSELGEEIYSEHPLMLRAGGEYYVRSIRRANPDGSLSFYCAIDEGLVLTMARNLDLVSTLETSLSPSRTGIEHPELIIGFECLHRRMEAERRGLTEAMGALMADKHVIGFHSYGEQADSVHINQTFTGIVLGGEA